MEYISQNESDKFDFTGSELLRSEIDGNSLILYIKGAYALENNSQNTLGADAYIPEMRMILSDFSLKAVNACGRRVLNQSGNSVREIKSRSLYKSELAAFTDRLADGSADIFSLSAQDDIVRMELNFSEPFDGECYFTAEICCSDVTAEWDCFGAVRPKKRLSLKERANRLKTDIPAIFLALGHKETPRLAKIISAAAVAYALSPIDLVPDFIPVLGYLDDVLVLPGLVYLAIRLIPDEVMAECRAKSEDIWKDGIPKKWVYAVPIALFWIIVIIIVIAAIK